MKKFFTEEEFDGMSEMVCMAIEEHGWLCDDGHWLTDEELAQWTDEMFVEAFALIYPHHVKLNTLHGQHKAHGARK